MSSFVYADRSTWSEGVCANGSNYDGVTRDHYVGAEEARWRTQGGDYIDSNGVYLGDRFYDSLTIPADEGVAFSEGA